MIICFSSYYFFILYKACIRESLNPAPLTPLLRSEKALQVGPLLGILFNHFKFIEIIILENEYELTARRGCNIQTHHSLLLVTTFFISLIQITILKIILKHRLK